MTDGATRDGLNASQEPPERVSSEHHSILAIDTTTDDATRDRLIDEGRSTAARFLAGWDYEHWLSRCDPTSG